MKNQQTFTLVELTVCLSIFVLLAILFFPIFERALEETKRTKCASNLRNIGIAYHLMAAERDGKLYSKEEIGNSSYRSGDDPLGLPDLFFRLGYLVNKTVWLSPGGRPELNKYGNNYAWSRSNNVTEKNIFVHGNMASTAIVWNNHTMTLPSVYNVAEPSTGGPRAAPASYRYYSWDKGTKINWLYLDGHVEKR